MIRRGSTWYKYGVMDVINPARFGTDGGTIRYRDLMRYNHRVVYRTCCCFSPRSLSLSPLFVISSLHTLIQLPLLDCPLAFGSTSISSSVSIFPYPSTPDCSPSLSTCLLGIPPPLLRYFPAPILSTVKDATFFASSASVILLRTANGSSDHQLLLSDLVTLHIRQDE
ncbi:uncharacterized protein BDW47DRAFT_11121 [Aspergillus candidus]|uniref:Uncharacterized protein n=1 Tax=Aspergillus candidus TaxID=41067 RepID=A0A2I2FG82_ASPCN|nr:hypothetical protein BDW47DRAFT_11121 [Aspergillus candidus]PLB39637.1 hypothetical protein BDW47DRAFT_11121 [Aspergillus candidus]